MGSALHIIVDTFHCERLRATLSESACVKRFTRAEAGETRFAVCRGCPVGADHAGVEAPVEQPLPKPARTLYNFSRVDWSKTTPQVVAAELGCHISTAYRARAKVIGKAAHGGLRDPHPIRWEDVPLGLVPDDVLAVLVDRHPDVVARHRRRLIRRGAARRLQRLERIERSPDAATPADVRLLLAALTRLVDGYSSLAAREPAGRGRHTRGDPQDQPKTNPAPSRA